MEERLLSCPGTLNSNTVNELNIFGQTYFDPSLPYLTTSEDFEWFFSDIQNRKDNKYRVEARKIIRKNFIHQWF